MLHISRAINGDPNYRIIRLICNPFIINLLNAWCQQAGGSFNTRLWQSSHEWCHFHRKRKRWDFLHVGHAARRQSSHKNMDCWDDQEPSGPRGTSQCFNQEAIEPHDFLQKCVLTGHWDVITKKNGNQNKQKRGLPWSLQKISAFSHDDACLISDQLEKSRRKLQSVSTEDYRKVPNFSFEAQKTVARVPNVTLVKPLSISDLMTTI